MQKVIDIEALLVWSYGPQRVEVVLGREDQYGPAILGRSGDGCVAIENLAMMGVSIDGGRGGAYGVHPDAEAVYWAVQRLQDVCDWQYHMVSACARGAVRPDWMPNATPYFRPVLNEKGRHKGRPRMILDKHGRSVGCEVYLALSQDQIDVARRKYQAWYSGLVGLLGILDWSSLRDYEPKAPSVPACPWETDGV